MRFATALNAAGAKKIPDQRSGSLKPAIDVPITRPTPSIGLVCGLMQAPDLVSAAIFIFELAMHLTQHCKQATNATTCGVCRSELRPGNQIGAIMSVEAFSATAHRRWHASKTPCTRLSLF